MAKNENEKEICMREKYGPEYISYIESGESAAVFVVRDIVDSIDTSNKWIDVVDFSVYEKRGRKAFNYIIVELFDRKITPQYPKHNKENIDEFDKKLMKYITWKTANEDIQNQRNQNVSGPKYLVLSDLVNKNKGKGYRGSYGNGFGNKRLKCVCSEKMSCYCADECKPEKIKYFIPEKEDWQYEIKNTKKLNNSQVGYIEENKNKIIEKIIEKRKKDINWFFDDKEDKITNSNKKKNNRKKSVNNHMVKSDNTKGKNINHR